LHGSPIKSAIKKKSTDYIGPLEFHALVKSSIGGDILKKRINPPTCWLIIKVVAVTIAHMKNANGMATQRKFGVIKKKGL